MTFYLFCLGPFKNVFCCNIFVYCSYEYKYIEIMAHNETCETHECKFNGGFPGKRTQMTNGLQYVRTD